jgi:hypothetical protein
MTQQRIPLDKLVTHEYYPVERLRKRWPEGIPVTEEDLLTAVGTCIVNLQKTVPQVLSPEGVEEYERVMVPYRGFREANEVAAEQRRRTRIAEVEERWKPTLEMMERELKAVNDAYHEEVRQESDKAVRAGVKTFLFLAPEHFRGNSSVKFREFI